MKIEAVPKPGGAVETHRGTENRESGSQQSMQTGNPILELVITSQMAEVAGNIATALQLARQAVTQARQDGDQNLVAAALLCLAKMRFRLGQNDQASDLAREALRIAEPDSPKYADAHLRLGSCAAEADEWGEAEHYYRQTVEIAREIGYHLAHMSALHSLAAGVYLPRGQFGLALATDEQAYRIARDHQLREWLHVPLVTIALVCQITGQRQKAWQSLAELVQVVVAGSAPQGYHSLISAALLLDEGDTDGAIEQYTQASSIAEATGEPGLTILVKLGLSRSHLCKGNASAAHQWAEEALSYAERMGYRRERGNALIARGRAAWKCGNLQAAESDMRAGLEVLGQLQVPYDQARGWFFLAALLHELDHPEAKSTWQLAVDHIQRGEYVFLLEQERRLAFRLLNAFVNHADREFAKTCQNLSEQLARVPPPRLRVHLLGELQVQMEGHWLESRVLRQRRCGELLALLLLSHDCSLTFEQIMEALWPGKEPSKSRTNFHHATSTLRRALEPELPDRLPSRYLEVEEGWVRLHLPPRSSLDIEEFRKFCKKGDWKQAVEVYRGPLLSEYTYQDWTVTPRQRLELLYQQALLGRAKQHMEVGHYGEALDVCQQLLSLEPWQENAVMIGMQACVGMKDLAGARRLYMALEKSLRDDLDTEPQGELQDFFTSLGK